MQIILTMLIFIALMLGIVSDSRSDKRIYSPIKIFNGIWIILFGIYHLKLSYIQSDFTTRALLAFLLCIVSFNATFFVANHIYHTKLKRNKGKKKLTPKDNKYFKMPSCIKKILEYPLPKKIRIINITFIVLFILEICYSGFLPLLSLFTKSGGNYLSFGIPSLSGFMYAIAICVGAYYLYKRDPRVMIYIGFGILSVSRQVIMSMIIEAAIIFICKYRKESSRIKHLPIKIVAVIVALVCGFTLFGNFRSGSNVMQNTFRPREQYENLPSSIMWLYSYTEFSFSNFNKLTTLTSGGTNLGANSLNAILPSVISNRMPIKKNFNQDYRVQANFNVSTWFVEIYIDFGLIGIAIFSMLVSLLGYVLYTIVLKKPSIRNCLLYAVFVHNILLFFFINMFLYLPVVSQFVFIPLIFRKDDE